MNKGSYYKLKTKKWFEEKGYETEIVEKLQRIWTPKGVFFKKQDVFGADGISMNEQEIIFWNSKFGKSNIAEGLKEFAKYPFPNFVKRWLVVWEARVREPEIVEFIEIENPELLEEAK